jgi:hypothetical protein
MPVQTDNEIYARAEQISNEINERANTKTRVGSLFRDIWESVLNRLQAKANSTDVANALSTKADIVYVDTAVADLVSESSLSQTLLDYVTEQVFEETTNTIASNLITEAQIRQAADTALQDAIAAEEQARIAADTALQDAIAAEEQARIAADTALQDAIDAFNGTSYTFENGVQENAGVVSLGGNLDNEIRFEGYWGFSFLSPNNYLSYIDSENIHFFGINGDYLRIGSEKIYANGIDYMFSNNMDSGNLVTDTWIQNNPPDLQQVIDNGGGTWFTNSGFISFIDTNTINTLSISPDSLFFTFGDTFRIGHNGNGIGFEVNSFPYTLSNNIDPGNLITDNWFYNNQFSLQDILSNNGFSNYTFDPFMNAGNVVTDTWVNNNPPSLQYILSSGGFSNYSFDPNMDSGNVITNTWFYNNLPSVNSITAGTLEVDYLEVNQNRIYFNNLLGELQIDTDKIEAGSLGLVINFNDKEIYTNNNNFVKLSFNNAALKRNGQSPQPINSVKWDECELVGSEYDSINDIETEIPMLRWSVRNFINGIGREYLGIPNINRVEPPADGNNYIFYVEGGALKIKGPSGTITTLAVE